MLLHEIIADPSKLYPHRTAFVLLLVPHARPYSSFMNFLSNATWTLIFIYIFIAIATAAILLIVFGYLQTKKILLKNISDVINLLLNDNSGIRYGQLQFADACVVVPLTFTGLIAMNGILSAFQSYLTWPIYERQINSIDDLFNSSIPIFQHYPAGLTIGILETQSGHAGWDDKIHQVEEIELFKELSSFNDSIAYILNYDRQGIQVFLEVQKRLNLKAFHLITETFLIQSMISFRVPSNFPFIESVNGIIHGLLSAGLMDKWIKDTDVN